MKPFFYIQIILWPFVLKNNENLTQSKKLRSHEYTWKAIKRLYCIIIFIFLNADHISPLRFSLEKNYYFYVSIKKKKYILVLRDSGK